MGSDRMLRTTINMRKKVYAKISHAAEKLGTSKRAIIIMLLMRVRNDINTFQGDFTLVKYQPRDPRGEWHHHHNPPPHTSLTDTPEAAVCSHPPLIPEINSPQSVTGIIYA